MRKKERKLTDSELKRKALFEIKSAELQGQGYEKKDLTIGVIAANIMAIVIMLPLGVALVFVYFMINADSFSVNYHLIEGILFLAVVIVFIIVHEVIHGITWGIFAKNHFQDIEFGVIWQMLTPYCTCKCELKRWQYIVGGIMPTIVVGVIPSVLGIVLNHNALFLLGLLMLIGGGGDVCIILKLFFHKEKGKECVYLDHPYECGVVVFECNKRQA